MVMLKSSSQAGFFSFFECWVGLQGIEEGGSGQW